MEIWKSVVGFHKYECSNIGNVRHIEHKNNIKMITSPSGYQLFSVRQNNKRYTLKMARVIAIAFIPNPQNYPQVNHRDGNKKNNSVSNLEWCTSKINMRHAFDNKLITPHRGADRWNAMLTDSQVIEILELLKLKVKQRDIAKLFGISPVTVCNIKYNRTWTHIKRS